MLNAGHWQALKQHGERLAAKPLADLMAAEPARAGTWALRVGPIHASFARQRIDDAAWAQLQSLANVAGLSPALAALFDGEIVNPTEGRPALHSALRGDVGRGETARAAAAQAREA
ncbi:MAG TPA: glucose-6-phosphate isomerase, partial [Arenimonas sp.]